MAGDSRATRYNATSLARALTILDVFGPRTAALGVSEIARSLGARAGSLYPALSTLERFGYLERDSEKRFRLGLKLLERGHALLANTGLPERAKPVLRDLARRLTVNAHLAVLHRGQVVYLDREEGSPNVVFPSVVGRLVPAHCTALGKVLLAHLEQDERRELLADHPLERRTRRTITSLRRLERDLADVRARGYAVDRQEFQEGVVCVAAPVRDHTGKVVAATSVSLLNVRAKAARMRKITREVVRTAALISQAIGYSPVRRRTMPREQVPTGGAYQNRHRPGGR